MSNRRRTFEANLPADMPAADRRKALADFDAGERNRETAAREPDPAIPPTVRPRRAPDRERRKARTDTPADPGGRQTAPERPTDGTAADRGKGRRTRRSGEIRPVEQPERRKSKARPGKVSKAAPPTALQRAEAGEARELLGWLMVHAPFVGRDVPGFDWWPPDAEPFVVDLFDAGRQRWDVDLVALARRAAELEDAEYGNVLERAAAHVPVAVSMTGHKWQIAPGGMLRRAPVSYAEYETLELPLNDRRELATLGYQTVAPAQLTLFGEDPETPLPIQLVAADAYGFTTLKPGKGARLDKRLLFDAMSAVPIQERRPGGHYVWEPTVEALAADHWARYRPGENGRALVEAMQAIRVGALVRVPDGRFFAPVTVRYIPDPRDPNSRAAFEILYPSDLAVGGPRYNRPALLAAGRKSDPAYDLELALAWHFDALRNHRRTAAPPVLDREARRRLACGPRAPRDDRHRRRQAEKADKILADLEAAGRLRIDRLPTGWRLIEPPDGG